MHGIDNAACAKKQQGFEECVDDQMKGGSGNGPTADGKHHIADLADGRIGQNPF